MAATLLLAGCGNVQSSLMPAGIEAGKIANLFLVMAIGAFVIWLMVVALAFYATVVNPERHSIRVARGLIIGGGVIFPVIVLTSLLAYGLALMPQLRAPIADDGLRIAVSGEQWWWRVRYLLPDGSEVVLANEIRLPVGERVEFLLSSPDVIHSFWVPSLAGKVDMTPGRTTTLTLTPTETGIYRGACAEYCGASHARMNFYVMVMEAAAFDEWLQHQAEPAQAPKSSLAVRGRDAFLFNGCGACHTVRNTAATGKVGPDLTHVGSRLSIAAGVLSTKPDNFRHWIEHPEAVKPGVYMPSFAMLPAEDLRAIAKWLDELQ
ncbi:MAG TPA: cytochrome c oxidase subunit II [Gammaproteobacteria bacterium]